MTFDVSELPDLRAVATDGVDVLSPHKDDLCSVRRPRWICAASLSEPPGLSSLNGPKPQRHLLVTASELPDQELRVVGRNGKQARVFKGRGHLLRIAAFHRSLHQIPVAIAAFQKENARSVGDDSRSEEHTSELQS